LYSGGDDKICKSIVIDEAIASIECAPKEITAACQIFEKQNGIQTAAQKKEWAAIRSMDQLEIEEIATRKLKIEKFKQQQWGSTTEQYFIQRKAKLDEVSFSIIRTKDQNLAQEIYFRIQNKEQTFSELACQFSEGLEANSGGMVATTRFGSLPSGFAQLLQNRRPGDLIAPFPTADGIVIIQINNIISARLDHFTFQRLLNEQFQKWLRQQVKQHGTAIKNLSFN